MKIEETILSGVKLLYPDFYADNRGFFLESFNKKIYEENNIETNFVQDNHSRSAKNVLRGLHFQKNNPQGKLVRCSKGRVLDVVVDINQQSSTYRQHIAVELSDENHIQLWIPPGYAHGFLVLSEYADFNYKCTNFYYKNDQHGLMWNDPEIAIKWPISEPILSEKDKKNMLLREL